MPIPLHYAAIQTDGAHISPPTLKAALGNLKDSVRGFEETSKHLVIGFLSEEKRDQLLQKRTIKLGMKDHALRSWPIPDTIKVRLKKVGLEATAEEVRKAIPVPVSKVVLETFKDAPEWKNGHAHFFLPKDQASKLPKEITLGDRKIKVSMPNSPDTSIQPTKTQRQNRGFTGPAAPAKQTVHGPRSQEGMPVASTSTSSATNSTPEPPQQSLQPEPMILVPVDGAPSTPVRPNKRLRPDSPLSNDGVPIVTLETLRDLGLEVPKCDALLSIYEKVQSSDDAVEQSRLFPTKLGVEVTKTDILASRKDGRGSDRFILHVPKDPDSTAVRELMESFGAVGLMALEKNFIQLLDLEEGILAVVLKSRIVQSLLPSLSQNLVK